MNISHSNCPKKPADRETDPIFEWDGFSMAGISGYECPLCHMLIMVMEEESDQK